MKLKKPNRKTLIFLVLAILFLPLLALSMYSFGIIFTYTGSIPVGFYRVTSSVNINEGNYISFCLPNDVAKMGLERKYIHNGSCKNGSEELIKKVIAIPGNVISINNDEIAVNGDKCINNYFAPTHIFDKNHKLVYRFIENGTYKAQGYWVYGSANPIYSWDSRYYGEIAKENVKHQLIPLWIF